jgi:hypothetical protein
VFVRVHCGNEGLEWVGEGGGGRVSVDREYMCVVIL